MGDTTERAFFTSLLALDADAPAAETIETALHALMALTRARYGRAEIQVRGEAQPLVLATIDAPSVIRIAAEGDDASRPPPLRTGVLSDVFETGFATARLELRSRRANVEPTFRERHLFELLFQAMARLSQRAHFAASGAAGLHEATRDFHAKLVANAVQRANGNVARAARELRVSRSFVYKMMRAAGRTA
jgi:hypothetical protein